MGLNPTKADPFLEFEQVCPVLHSNGSFIQLCKQLSERTKEPCMYLTLYVIDIFVEVTGVFLKNLPKTVSIPTTSKKDVHISLFTTSLLITRPLQRLAA